MAERIKDVFVSELTRTFGFLNDHGFRFREDEVEDTVSLVRAAYLGRNIAFVFVLDKREEMLECYIHGVKDGQLLRMPTEGGGYKSLFLYLVKNHGFRRSIKDSLRSDRPMREKIRDILEVNADLIKLYGEVLLADRA
ncbi:MAG: hypothetical protein OEZ03_10780 [Alphaproteobacteria bacterium]|nr:hypothetical protein [Alphaproteobacteria bacterium]